ncbi:MAG: Ku domain protein [Deltaproteobacteria bacterium]|nr:Ku domain protein [Deltaproteobacteria bacterium]
MTARAIWKGRINFGEYSIPVKLHTAVREQRIQFHLLHSNDQTRLRQQMVCAYEHIPVPREEQVRGFEWEDGKYVIIDDEELEWFEPEDSRTIEVHEFVKAGDIDPLYFERVYYLGPDASQQEYDILASALSDTGMEGVCTWTMRKRSYLGSLKARGKIIRLIALRYADEVIAAASLDLPRATLSEKELKVGSDLVRALTGPFQPDKFENEHQRKLQEMIDRKAAGEKISILRPKKKKTTAPDRLLETLEASLKQVG